jgi:hypothetical protein
MALLHGMNYILLINSLLMKTPSEDMCNNKESKTCTASFKSMNKTKKLLNGQVFAFANNCASKKTILTR